MLRMRIHGRRPGRARKRERGSASVELALLTPVLILFLLLYLGFGRISHAKQLVNDAAAQAARAATLTYLNPGQAQSAAQSTAAQSLAAGRLSCASNTVTVDTGNDRPGGSITVRVECQADLSQAVAAGLPGAVTISASATSPIDVYVPSSGGAS